jgi:hypothetical protein
LFQLAQCVSPLLLHISHLRECNELDQVKHDYNTTENSENKRGVGLKVGTVSHFNSADGAQLPSYLEMLLPPATARCRQCKLPTSFHLHRLHHSGELEERAGGWGEEEAAGCDS